MAYGLPFPPDSPSHGFSSEYAEDGLQGGGRVQNGRP